MALRSIDLFAVPGQAPGICLENYAAPGSYEPLAPVVVATLAALERMPKNWKKITVPGSSPFPGLHPWSKTPIVSLPALLTNTSKMPCPSWGLPAGKACPGAKYLWVLLRGEGQLWRAAGAACARRAVSLDVGAHEDASWAGCVCRLHDEGD